MDIRDKTVKGYDFSRVSSDFFGVKPSKKALEIADYEFFWDSGDQLAPFGSEEGYIAFIELNEWLDENPGKPIIEYFKWVFSIWDMELSDFDDKIIEEDNIIKTIQDYDFDDTIFAFDVTLIASGFGQLIIQGKIDESIKNIVHLAILRQSSSIVLNHLLFDKESWKYDRFRYLQILIEILEKV